MTPSQVNDSNGFTIQACRGMQRKGGPGREKGRTGTGTLAGTGAVKVRVTPRHWRRPEQVSSLCLPVCLSLDTRGRGDRKQAVATPFLAQAKAGQADK